MFVSFSHLSAVNNRQETIDKKLAAKAHSLPPHALPPAQANETKSAASHVTKQQVVTWPWAFHRPPFTPPPYPTAAPQFLLSLPPSLAAAPTPNPRLRHHRLRNDTHHQMYKENTLFFGPPPCLPLSTRARQTMCVSTF